MTLLHGLVSLAVQLACLWLLCALLLALVRGMFRR